MLPARYDDDDIYIGGSLVTKLVLPPALSGEEGG